MNKYGKPRCGLCGEYPEPTWEEHKKSMAHQSRLPQETPYVRMIPKPVVSKISDFVKRKNKREGIIAKATDLGYISAANGRSGNLVRCECGQTLFVFAWRGCKRCPNCWKVIGTHLGISFHLQKNSEGGDST